MAISFRYKNGHVHRNYDRITIMSSRLGHIEKMFRFTLNIVSYVYVWMTFNVNLYHSILTWKTIVFYLIGVTGVVLKHYTTSNPLPKLPPIDFKPKPYKVI